MSLSKPSTPHTALPASPIIPLTPALRAAYQDLYDEYEDAIEATNDPALERSLLASQSNIETLLNDDAGYGISANTVLYNSLLEQINSTNNDLKVLQAQILSISSRISTFSDILAAITKVLSMMPGV